MSIQTLDAKTDTGIIRTDPQVAVKYLANNEEYRITPKVLSALNQAQYEENGASVDVDDVIKLNPSRLFIAPKSSAPRLDDFRQVQAWNGEVTGIDGEYFYANLRDFHTNAIENAEIHLSRVEEDDLNMLRIGAPFVWSIGSFAGKAAIDSNIRFRRIPALTEEELITIQKAASEYDFLSSDDPLEASRA